MRAIERRLEKIEPEDTSDQWRDYAHLPPREIPTWALQWEVVRNLECRDVTCEEAAQIAEKPGFTDRLLDDLALHRLVRRQRDGDELTPEEEAELEEKSERIEKEEGWLLRYG